MTKTLKEVLRRAAAMIFPWPSKDDRHAAVASARREKEHSRAAAARAKVIEGQIQRMAEENHFAAKIAGQIARGDQR